MPGRTRDTSHVLDAPHVDPFEPTVGLLGILRVLFKWSFIVAPLGALTIWLALAQSEDIKPEFTAEISVILIGPNEILIEDFETGEIFVEGVNPLQALGGTLTTVAQVTVLSMNDPSVPDRLASEGLTAKYEIGTLDLRSPILVARAFDIDPAQAARTIDRIEELIIEDLADRQERLGAPPANRISTQTISKGVDDDPDFGARDRVRLAIAGVGFAISAASAFFLEGLAELWRRRRRRKAATEAEIEARGLPAGDRTHDRVEASVVETFDDLYTSENGRLVATLHFLTGDEDLATEISNETLDRAASVWPVPSRSHPIVWLYGEAVGRTLVRPSSERRPASTSDDNELWRKLLELPAETRAVIALAYIGELRNDRIATALSLDLRTVDQHREQATRVLSKIRSTSSEADEADEIRKAAQSNTATSDELPEPPPKSEAGAPKRRPKNPSLGLTPDSSADGTSTSTVDADEQLAPSDTSNSSHLATGLSPDTPNSKKAGKNKPANQRAAPKEDDEDGEDLAETSLPTADVPEQPKARS